MLEFLRRHTMVVMAAMALVFLGLVFIDRQGTGSMFSTQGSIMTVGTTDYTEKDLHRSLRALQLVPEIESLIPYVNSLTTFPNSPDPRVAFFANLGILQAEGERLGVLPSESQIDEAIKQLPEFQTEAGEYDSATYLTFINANGKNAVGEITSNLRYLVRNKIIFSNIQTILTKGIETNEDMARTIALAEIQAFTFCTASLPIESFAPKSTPGDDEVQKYWQDHRTEFLSPESRVITLAVFTPRSTPAPKDSAATESTIPVATLEVHARLEGVCDMIRASSGRDLQKQIEEAKPILEPLCDISITTYKSVIQSNPPEIFNMQKDENAGSKGTLLETAFAIVGVPRLREKEEEAQLDSPLTDEEIAAVQAKVMKTQLTEILILKDGRLVIMRIDGVQSPTPLPFDAAKEQASQALIKQLTQDSLAQAGESLAKDLKDKATTEDNFKQIAESAGAKVQFWNNVSRYRPTTGLPGGDEVLSELFKVNNNETASLINTGTGIVIPFLVERTVENSPDAAAAETTIVKQLNQMSRTVVMMDWLHDCAKRYKVTPPSLRR